MRWPLALKMYGDPDCRRVWIGDSKGRWGVTSQLDRDDSVTRPRAGVSGQLHARMALPTAFLSAAGVVKLADARDSKSRGVYAT